MLVVSPAPFNELGLALVCPVTQGGKSAREHGFTVSLSGMGTKTQGVILSHQMRVISYQERGGTIIEQVPVIARIQTLLE